MSGKNDLQDQPKVPPEALLLQMSIGQTVSQLIYVAAKLGIADQLKDGPMSIDGLAECVKAHTRSLYRVMRALSSLGIFAEIEHGLFQLTPLADPLRTENPSSLRAWTIMVGELWHRHAWDEILYSVKTGKSAFEHVFGMGTFDYFTRNPEDGAVFNEAMRNLTEGVSSAILAAYDFSKIKKIVDVGGGKGSLLTAILKENLEMQGILYDLPQVVEEARVAIENEGVSNRCELVPGDFFESIPSGGDAYIMKYIIHDWGDDKAMTILQNCRRSMSTRGKLLLAESVIPPGNAPHIGKFADILMLIMEGGFERTEGEFQCLLEASGFKLTNIIETQSPLSVIEAAPVE